MTYDFFIAAVVHSVLSVFIEGVKQSSSNDCMCSSSCSINTWNQSDYRRASQCDGTPSL